MIRVGTVNIDTSHPIAFAELFLKSGRAKYTAVYNDGFRTDDEVKNFMDKFGVEERYYDLSEMAKNIDIVFIQSCNWDRHVELMMPFIEAGVPVFVDKPLVGSIDDCKTVEKLAKDGAVIIGSSAMRYTFEHKGILSMDVAQRGEIVHLSATVGVDEFIYAIHAVESLLGFFRGIKAISTTFIGTAVVGESECDTFFVKFENGVTATYHICTNAWQPSTLTVVTTKTTYAFKIDSGKVYEAMLNEVLDFMEGKENNVATIYELTEATKIMLAGKQSKLDGGVETAISDIRSERFFDGDEFEKFYESQQRK